MAIDGILRSSLLELGRTKRVFGFGRAFNGCFAILGISSLQFWGFPACKTGDFQLAKLGIFSLQQTPRPAPCSLQLLSHCSATLSHSSAAFKNDCLPTACLPLPIACQPLHISRQKHFPAFESISKGQKQDRTFAMLGFWGIVRNINYLGLRPNIPLKYPFRIETRLNL